MALKVDNVAHWRALKRGYEMYREQTNNRRVMIARHIESRQPVPAARGNLAQQKEIAEIFGVSLRVVRGIWVDVMRYRCDCCGHVKLPADYEVDYA